MRELVQLLDHPADPLGQVLLVFFHFFIKHPGALHSEGDRASGSVRSFGSHAIRAGCGDGEVLPEEGGQGTGQGIQVDELAMDGVHGEDGG